MEGDATFQLEVNENKGSRVFPSSKFRLLPEALLSISGPDLETLLHALCPLNDIPFLKSVRREMQRVEGSLGCVLGRGHPPLGRDFVHWLPWALSASVLWWLNMVAAVGQLLKDPVPVSMASAWSVTRAPSPL